jgi:hypothetical protein
MEQDLIFPQDPGGFRHSALLQAHFTLGSILAAHYLAQQGQASGTNLADVRNKPKANAGHGFAGQLAIEFARPAISRVSKRMLGGPRWLNGATTFNAK